MPPCDGAEGQVPAVGVFGVADGESVAGAGYFDAFVASVAVAGGASDKLAFGK
jgi:hypothetical protein